MRLPVRGIDPKAPAECIPVTFDFIEDVPAIDSATVTISVKDGSDPNVATMLFGAHMIVGAEVRQLIRNGADAVTYLVRADIVSGNEKYALACYLAVRELI